MYVTEKKSYLYTGIVILSHAGNWFFPLSQSYFKWTYIFRYRIIQPLHILLHRAQYSLEM